MRVKLLASTTCALILIASLLNNALGQNTQEKTILEQNQVLYDSVVEGIHITPGAWRPLFGTEHIAWVTPPWYSQEYIWLDFPEAIFSGQDLLFLSHINPPFPAKYNNLPKVEWQKIDKGIKFERQLPNGIKFGGSVIKKDKTTVGLKLWIHNGSSETLSDIKLQTCAYLNEIEEFDENSNSNKLVHVPDHGWKPFEDAKQIEGVESKFKVGWLRGPSVSDLPVILTVSKQKNHLVAMTWFENTLSFIGNKNHPCFHADPFFPDLKPGQKHTITGELIFFEGSVEEFEKMFAKRLEVQG